MRCDWQERGPRDANGITDLYCARPGCGRVIRQTKHLPDEINGNDSCLADRRKQPLPGTELSSLIKLLGLRRKEGCDCCAMIAKMDRWGIDGCREHRAEIVAHLNKAYHGLTWAEVAAATAGVVITGLAWKIDRHDIAGSLLDLAIERAEAT